MNFFSTITLGVILACAISTNASAETRTSNTQQADGLNVAPSPNDFNDDLSRISQPNTDANITFSGESGGFSFSFEFSFSDGGGGTHGDGFWNLVKATVHRNE